MFDLGAFLAGAAARPDARPVLHGVPEGYDARLLGALAGPHIHVCRDDARMAALAEAIAFFAPEAGLLRLPAWDCLPYDRVSPNPEIVAERLEALTRLTEPAAPRLLLTTVAAVLQRVPARAQLAGAVLTLRAGRRYPLATLTDFFARNGYQKADTVREPGEFAVRGGIVDLFPAGAGQPVRLDFFGDDLDGIRGFDPMSQRSAGKIAEVVLRPASEVVLDEAAVQRFRSGYRAAFGGDTGGDPLYEAVSAGRRHMGMEHWLPLFHDRLETVFDYLPGASVSFDHQVGEAVNARLEQIGEYYQSRRSLLRGSERDDASVYKPLPPDALYVTAEEFSGLLAGRPVAAFSPFAGAEGAADAGGRIGRDFAEARARADGKLFDAVAAHLAEVLAGGRRLMVAAYTEGARDRLANLLAEHAAPRVDTVVLGLERGFESPDLVVVAEPDILGDRLSRPARRRRKADAFIAEAAALAEGDLVVHVDHGIGRFDGLVTLEVGGAPHDCLRVLYAGGDKLFVPVENIEVLSRYGSEEAGAQLDKLGGAGWQARKARVKQRLREMADRLIALAAERQLRQGEAFMPPEGAWDEFCARFPYAETEDQLRAISEVAEDMASGRPMDRLVCGDVGFGKTEVALRAAFLAVMGGAQVAVVVPTTLLARQHYRTVVNRFAGLPVKVAQMSRLVTGKEAAAVKAGIAAGDIDIVVGTHALLAPSIAFKRLGLLIVDEEQHFGVAQKERLKELKSDVHVLTLTATPIPRTLQMALTGLREMSVITTPPVDRLAVRTFVLPFDGMVIREAILREHFRGGQTFYVCPRIEDLARVHDRIAKLVPEVKIATAHGRLPTAQLEDVMTRFYEGAFDVLLSTNIVESGLDVPSANTLIIHRADMFGLAQLYQLRGRVGRSKTRAYAYLTLSPGKQLTPTAQRRLEVMQTLDHLGAGFTLASHDLDIRGAGNLLGDEQSGHIKEVGVELYQQLLEDAIAERKGAGLAGPAQEEWQPQIAVGMPVLIPEAYVADLTLRLTLYRRIAGLTDRAEIDAFAAEMIDRFGPLPPEVENLLQVVAIKRLCRQAGIEKLDAGPKGAVLAFHQNRFAKPQALVHYLAQQKGTVQLRPDHKLVLRRPWEQPETRMKGLSRVLSEIAALAA
ncbi:MAG: transcription-repair coupling factor [Thalassobaculales bacterium]